jgi:hypothetical protein
LQTLKPSAVLQGGDAAAEAPPNIPWGVTVVTSDVRGAGTDADIALVLVGEGGKQVGPLKLLSAPGHDPFERGQTDTFVVEVGGAGG